MSHIQLLQALHLADRRRERSLEMVEADIKDSNLVEKADLRWQARGKIIIEEDDLIQGLPHLPNAPRNAAAEIVVGQDQNRDGGVAQILRNPELEPVVIEENSVQILVEELGRHRAFELVEPEIQELELGHGEDDVREGADEAVVAEVELVEKLEVLEGGGDEAAEAVGVEVEESEVGEAAELGREVAGDVGMVEVEAGDDTEGGIRGGGGAVDTGVGADVGPDPVGGEVEGVGEDGGLPCLEGNVGLPESGILKPQALALALCTADLDEAGDGKQEDEREASMRRRRRRRRHGWAGFCRSAGRKAQGHSSLPAFALYFYKPLLLYYFFSSSSSILI